MEITKEAKILTIKEAAAMMINCPHFDKKFINPSLFESAILAMRIGADDKSYRKELYLIQKGRSTKAAFVLIEKENGESKTKFLNEKDFKNIFEVNYM